MSTKAWGATLAWCTDNDDNAKKKLAALDKAHDKRITWIAQEEERDRLNHKALADVDAGRVIEHLAVQAWADGLSADLPVSP